MHLDGAIMDKETAIELERLKAGHEAHEYRLHALELEVETWKAMVKRAVIKMVKYLLTLGAAGLTFGLNLPEHSRKMLIRWLE